MTRTIEKANAHGKLSISEPNSGRMGDITEMNTNAHEAFLCGSEMPENPNWGTGRDPEKYPWEDDREGN